MNITGIITEYNPFHNGHAYQISALRKKTNADYIVIAMSGNFLQRGVPALCDKFTRTKMALECGADLVLELPTLWATASAEYFAKGGVSLLSGTGIITHLGFGAESEDLTDLMQISSILKEEPEIYRKALADAIRFGNSFPTARKNALMQMLPSFKDTSFDKLLDTPNNILALEYLKSLPQDITPVLIPRKGAGYHDKELETPLPSATAIRTAIFSTKEQTKASCQKPYEEESEKDGLWSALSSAMPQAACEILNDYRKTYACMETNDFSSMMGYRLLSLAETDFSHFADCNRDVSNKINNHLKNYVTLEDFTQTLKTKNMTYTRISRCLLHILLNITQSDYEMGKLLGYTPYLRVLGFRKDASCLLSEIKKNSALPLITKTADADSILNKDAYSIFQKDLFASALYYQCMAVKSNTKPLNEFTNQIVIR